MAGASCPLVPAANFSVQASLITNSRASALAGRARRGQRVGGISWAILPLSNWQEDAGMDVKPEFAAADKAVARAAGKIEQAMVELLEKTLPLSGVVATDYVVETLADALITRNPAALEWLNRQRGKSSMRLANALMDWRDMWAKR
jgi:hypothetical protein